MPEPWEVNWDAKRNTATLDARTIIDQRLTPKKKKRPKDVHRAGPNNHSQGSIDALVDYLRTPKKKRDPSLLDDIIYNDGLDSVPFPEISRKTGLPISEVRKRFMEMLEAHNTFSQAEMQLLLTAQLRRVINMMTELASKGSERHADVILKSIERLQKMYELENGKANIKIEIVTVEQTNVIITALGYVIERFREHPAIANVIDADVFEQIGADALGEASALIFEAQDREILLDSAGKRL